MPDGGYLIVFLEYSLLRQYLKFALLGILKKKHPPVKTKPPNQTNNNNNILYTQVLNKFMFILSFIAERLGNLGIFKK